MPYFNDLLDNNIKIESLESVAHICELSRLYNKLSTEEQKRFEYEYIKHTKSFAQSHFVKRVSFIPSSIRNRKDAVSGKIVNHDIVINYQLSYSCCSDNNNKIYNYFDFDINSIALQCREMGLGCMFKKVDNESCKYVVNISIPTNDQKKKESAELEEKVYVNYKSIATNTDSVERIWFFYSDYCKAENSKIYVEHIIEEYFNFSYVRLKRCLFSFEIINIEDTHIEKSIFFYKGEHKQTSVKIVYLVRNTNSFNSELLDKHIDNKINNICSQCIDAGLVFKREEMKNSSNSIYSIKIEPRIE